MSAVLNDRDVLLQAALERVTNANAERALFLTPDTNFFHVTNTGAGTPDQITLTAKPLNIPGEPTFSVTPGAVLTGSGFTRTLAFASMSASTATVTAQITYGGLTYVARSVIGKMVDGAAGVPGLANAHVYAYQRAASAPTLPPGAVTYTFASAAITAPAGDALANGWRKTIPAGTEPLYVSVASASSSDTTDTIAAAEWSPATLLVVSGTPGAAGSNGAPGLSTATLYIYKRAASATPPALPSATATYTFNPAGLTGLDNGWSTGIPSAGGAYLHVSTATAVATADTPTDTIAPSEWAAPSLMAQDGINGAAGLTNALVYAYQRSASVPALLPGAVTYTFALGAITTPATDALANGWTKSIPDGNSPLYVAIASASGSGATDAITNNEWATPVKLAADGVAGAPGLNSATVYIYQRAATNVAPALPSADTIYTFNPAALAGLNNGWATTIPAYSNGGFLFVSTATAAAPGATDTITASEWAAAQLMSQDGAAGPRGSQTLYVAGSAWSDAAADAATTGANVVGDTVTISNNSNYTLTKTWTGSAWVAPGTVIDGNLLVTNSVKASAVDARGLAIRDAQGNVILGAGSALQAAYLDRGSGVNLLGNSAPGSTAGYYAAYSTTLVAPSAAALNTQWNPPGMKSVFTSVPATLAALGGNGRLFDLAKGNQGTGSIPVAPGKRYELSAYISAHRCTAYVVIAWRRLDGSYIGETNGKSITAACSKSNSLADWDASGRSVLFATAPAEAALAAVYIRAAATGDNPYIFASMWYFGEAGVNQATPTRWSDGGLGQEGGALGSLNAFTAANAAAYFEANSLQGAFIQNLVAEKIIASSLSAISANMGVLTAGLIRSGTSGQRTEISPLAFRCWDANGTNVIELGVYS